jgi:hypothetical protein
MTSTPLTQSQRGALVDTSLALLVQEQAEAQQLVDAVSAGDPGQRRLALRTLLTMRPAAPLPERLQAALDQLLSAEAAERETVEALSLPGTEVDPRLSLWRGDITTIRADAIVNAANSAMLGCFQPLHTCIDNAIHSVAGPGLRQECADIMAARGRLEPTGTATVTGGYHLPAAHVIHTVGPIVQGKPTAEHEALLASSYQSCLLAAEDLQATSIALCCISTGIFGYPKAEAATIAVRTVREVLPHCQSLTKVVFNVFDPIDESIYRDLLGPDR